MSQHSPKDAAAAPASGPARDAAEAISPDSFAQLDGEKFTHNMLRVGVQSQQLLTEFVKRMAQRTARRRSIPSIFRAPFWRWSRP